MRRRRARCGLALTRRNRAARRAAWPRPAAAAAAAAAGSPRPAFLSFAAQPLDELVNADLLLRIAAHIAHPHHVIAAFDITTADHHHVRHAAQLGVADLALHALAGTLVHLSANAGGTQPLCHRID